MQGDEVANLDVSTNATIHLDTTSDNLYLQTENPMLKANLQMRGSSLIHTKNFIIDTSAPTVDQTVGMVASASLGTTDKTYTVGDSLYFTVKFTKPVTGELAFWKTRKSLQYIYPKPYPTLTCSSPPRHQFRLTLVFP